VSAKVGNNGMYKVCGNMGNL